MNAPFRNLAFAFGASLALVACKDSRTVEDVLAEDSTLALEVMAANRDTLAMPVDTGTPVETPPSTEPVQEPAPEVEPSPAPAAVAEVSESRPASRRRSSPARVRRTRSTARPTARSASARVASRTSARTIERRLPVESTPMKSSATIPAGTELSLTSDQRICASMSNPGDRFTARFAEDVVGPIGVVIPKGTAATAQIFSLEKSVDLTMQSITFAGNTYSLDSDVTFTEVEKVTSKSSPSSGRVAAGAGIGAVTGGVIGGSVPGAVIGAAGGALAGAVTSRRTSVDHCVPDGGQITVRLTEPLKLALSE